jgi:WD40 repeat protein
MSSHQDESPAAKRLKLEGKDDDDAAKASLKLDPVFTEENPHGCHAIRAMVAVSEDEILTCARRDIKVWKKQSDDTWVCSNTLGANFWDNGNMRSHGGPTTLSMFRDRFVIAGDTAGEITIWARSTWRTHDSLEFKGSRNKERDVSSILVLDESTFLVGFLNGNIDLWALDLGSEDDFVRGTNKSFKPHKGSAIRSMVRVSDDRIGTGSEDNTIKIWKVDRILPLGPAFRSWTCERTMMPNEGFVVQLAMHDHKLLSVHELHEDNKDKSTICVWNMESGEEEHRFNPDHEYKINALHSFRNRVLTSGLDGTKVWTSLTWLCESHSKEAKGESTTCGDSLFFGCGFLEVYRVTK